MFETMAMECVDCEERFASPGDLQDHKNLVHKRSNDAYKCPLCGADFMVLGRYQRHLRKYHDIEIFKCSVCKFSASREDTLTNHMKVHDKKFEPVPCETCKNMLKTTASLNNHKIGHQKYQCKICLSQEAFSQNSLEQHIQKNHNDSERFECTLCKVSYNMNKKLLRHNRRFHNMEVFKCEKCSFCTNEEVSLKDHIQSMHPPKEKFQPVTCELCDLTITNRLWLLLHKKIHEKNEYECEICGQFNRTKQILNNHMKKFHSEGGEIYECDQCGNIFGKSKVLAKHKWKKHGAIKEALIEPEEEKLVIPHEKKEYKCEICGQTTRTKKILKNHMKKHTENEEIYECDQCGKIFNREKFLAKHKWKFHGQMQEAVLEPVVKIEELMELDYQNFETKESFNQMKYESKEKIQKFKRFKKKHSKPPVSLNCPNCNLIFHSFKMFSKHSEQEKTACQRCSDSFCDKEKYAEHLRDHLKEIKDLPENTPPPNIYQTELKNYNNPLNNSHENEVEILDQIIETQSKYNADEEDILDVNNITLKQEIKEEILDMDNIAIKQDMKEEALESEPADEGSSDDADDKFVHLYMAKAVLKTGIDAAKLSITNYKNSERSIAEGQPIFEDKDLIFLFRLLLLYSKEDNNQVRAGKIALHYRGKFFANDIEIKMQEIRENMKGSEIKKSFFPEISRKRRRLNEIDSLVKKNDMY